MQLKQLLLLTEYCNGKNIPLHISSKCFGRHKNIQLLIHLALLSFAMYKKEVNIHDTLTIYVTMYVVSHEGR